MSFSYEKLSFLAKAFLLFFGLNFIVVEAFASQGSSFDEWIKPERDAVLAAMAENPNFAAFAHLPRNLLDFLISEKLHMSMTSSTREIISESGELISGLSLAYDCVEDEFHPQVFKPFAIKAFWLPAERGEIFSLLGEEDINPLVRTTAAGKKEVLFFVHPKSESLYAPLIREYEASKVEAFALSLSSFRSLLVALPDDQGGFKHVMIKVSLDERLGVGGVHRLVSHKEAGGSVAASSVMNKKTTLAVMQDVFAFSPAAELIVPRADLEPGTRAGMILRKIPDFLLEPSSFLRLIPLYALLGKKNKPLLDLMIKNSGKSPTNFVRENILLPYARVYTDLLFDKRISIEAHGQNLLLVLDARTALPIPGHEFLYRDMGGVNCFLRAEELEALPANLANPELFYFDSHLKDAAASLEGHFVQRVLFNLNKQFVKSDYASFDPQFEAWKTAVSSQGQLLNWTGASLEDDLHQEQMHLKDFCHYGYFEKIFIDLLIDQMQVQGVFRKIQRENFTPSLFSSEDLRERRLLFEDKRPFKSFEMFLTEVYSFYF